MDFMPYVLQKWNLKALNDEAGRKWSLNSRDTIQTQCGARCTKLPKSHFVDKPSHLFDETLKTSQGNFNSNRPSWDTLSFFANTTNNHVRITPMGPCMSKIEGQITLPKWVMPAYTLHPLPQRMAVDTLQMANCNAMHPLLKYIPVRPMRSTVQLYYVMVLASSSDMSLNSMLNNLADNGNDYINNKNIVVNLLLVVMKNNDDVKKQTKFELYIKLMTRGRVNVFILRTSPPFGRSVGLKMGYHYIRTTLESLSDALDHDVVVFSLDASFKLPMGFSKQIVKSVACGKVAYAPVFKQGRTWAEGSYGAIGLCLSDYFKLPKGWSDQLFDSTLATEDIDVIAQIQKRLIVHRPRVQNYFDITAQKSIGHSRQKYGVLPVVPITHEKDLRVSKKIQALIKQEENNWGVQFEKTIWRTQMRPEDATVIYSLWEEETERLIIVSMAIPEVPEYAQAESLEQSGN